jgi:hypothetical protein
MSGIMFTACEVHTIEYYLSPFGKLLYSTSQAPFGLFLSIWEKMKLYTTKEAAKKLGIAIRTLYSHAITKKAGEKVNNKWRFTDKDLEIIKIDKRFKAKKENKKPLKNELCSQCGKKYNDKKWFYFKTKDIWFCSRSCMCRYVQLNSKRYKREMINDGRKYKLIKSHHRACKSGYVLNSILVMEEKLGRKINKGEIIHHIDGDKTNDSPNNLMVCSSQLEHLSYHKQKKIKIKCWLCGKEREVYKSQVREKNFCGRKHARYYSLNICNPKKRNFYAKHN